MKNIVFLNCLVFIMSFWIAFTVSLCMTELTASAGPVLDYSVNTSQYFHHVQLKTNRNAIVLCQWLMRLRFLFMLTGYSYIRVLV